MVQKARPPHHKAPAKPAAPKPEPEQEQPQEQEPTDTGDIVERPDGYFWTTGAGEEEFGPYETYELAAQARDASSEEALAPGSALQGDERAIGIADWIDAETGEPAENPSGPHLPEE